MYKNKVRTKPAMLTIIENSLNLETSRQEVLEQRVQTTKLICDDPIPGSG